MNSTGGDRFLVESCRDHYSSLSAQNGNVNKLLFQGVDRTVVGAQVHLLSSITAGRVRGSQPSKSVKVVSLSKAVDLHALSNGVEAASGNCCQQEVELAISGAG